jgi:hypothetical protein
MMIFTGLVGYCWALAAPQTNNAAPIAANRRNAFIDILPVVISWRPALIAVGLLVLSLPLTGPQ